MTTNNPSTATDFAPPPLALDAQQRIEPASLASVIEWFLAYDPRVAIFKHPAINELFEWKRREERQAQTIDAPQQQQQQGLNAAEDVLAINIMQAVVTHSDEAALRGWIKNLLETLEEASKINEELSSAYNLNATAEASAVKESERISTATERTVYLMSCWLEAICTAELRVLGWIYQSLYGRAFSPNNY